MKLKNPWIKTCLVTKWGTPFKFERYGYTEAQAIQAAQVLENQYLYQLQEKPTSKLPDSWWRSHLAIAFRLYNQLIADGFAVVADSSAKMQFSNAFITVPVKYQSVNVIDHEAEEVINAVTVLFDEITRPWPYQRVKSVTFRLGILNLIGPLTHLCGSKNGDSYRIEPHYE